MMLAVLFCIGYAAYLFGTPHWHYRMMKKIAKDAVLTYRVSGSRQSAEQRYKSGLKQERIPLYIDDRDCLFIEAKSQFSIECEWTAPIVIPILEMDVSQNYRFKTTIDRNGTVQDY